MIDMHCHIVPYTDDGAIDNDASLEMGKLAMELGYTDIICTSHYIVHDIENDYNKYRDNVDKLNKLFETNGITVKLHPGNEIFFTNDIVNLVKDKKVSSLNDTKYVLVEFPLFNNTLPMNAYDEFNALQDAGYTPILAHPERYDFVSKGVECLIPLVESGVLLQANMGSINGKYGKHAQKNLKKMLKLNMVHFFGTDSHNTSVYEMQEKALKKVKKIIKDDELIEKIFVENPNKVLNNEKISIWYPKSK